MSKTILITGTSSGIGRAAVQYFSARGWKVAATMRHPEKEKEMQQWAGVKLYALDVMNTGSIEKAIQDVLKDNGGIDVICNNAGYGAVGIFEKATVEQIQQQFDTNVFGCMNVIRAILPHFRSKKDGTIINITSMGGLITFPIYSVYNGTKWAMEGFSEALAYELRPLGIRVKCVEPGAIKTDFYTRSQTLFKNETITDYDAYEAVTMRNTQESEQSAPGPEIVAKKIYQAATDNNYKLRYPAGPQSSMLLVLRRVIPMSWFSSIVRMVVEKGYKK
jgi:short-subunit dehydrogenase